jgi:hypothetical protein
MLTFVLTGIIFILKQHILKVPSIWIANRLTITNKSHQHTAITAHGPGPSKSAAENEMGA